MGAAALLRDKVFFSNQKAPPGRGFLNFRVWLRILGGTAGARKYDAKAPLDQTRIIKRGSMGQWTSKAVVCLAAGMALTLTPCWVAGVAEGKAQQTLAFWAFSSQEIDPILLQVPASNGGRLEILERLFREFGCREKMAREAVRGRDLPDNLSCTLPGEGSGKIVVLARYDGSNFSSSSWADALMLPLLYHALEAQPRQHTFEFVEVDGRAGAKAYFSGKEGRRRKKSEAIVLDSLGRGAPNCYGVRAPGQAGSVGGGPICATALQVEGATGVHHSRGKLAEKEWNMHAAATAQLFDDVLFKRVRHGWSAMFYSRPWGEVDVAEFHQDFDVLAWLLCRIDGQVMQR